MSIYLVLNLMNAEKETRFFQTSVTECGFKEMSYGEFSFCFSLKTEFLIVYFVSSKKLSMRS